MTATHKFAGLIPEMLVRQLRQRRCVLYTGAGLSAQAKAPDGKPLPTWRPLLKEMIAWCVSHRVQLRADPSEMQTILDKGRLLVVAQELQQVLGGQLNACLSDVLHAGNVQPSEAHEWLCRTDWVAVLSSNYDGLIEGAYAAETGGVLPPVLSESGVGSALNCLRNDSFFVFKLHGDVNIPGSIVLGDRDYSRLLYLSPAYRSFLETVFATYTVLFVGFGGSDPDLENVVDRLSAIYERSISQHFLLISEDEFSALERRRLLEDKRLDCITYQWDAAHSQVVEFLKALAARTAPALEPPALFKPEQDRPRAFVSGSYQDIGLLDRIVRIAERAGFDVWFAGKQLSVGDVLVDAVSRAVDEADCFIVVLSDSSADSRWVHFEIGRAWGAHKRIVPIRVGDASLPSDLMGLFYLGVKTTELTQDEEAFVEKNLRSVAEALRDS